MSKIYKAIKDIEIKTKNPLPAGKKRRRYSQAVAQTKATEMQWQLVDMAIKAFIAKYPIQWIMFQEDLKRGRNEYNVAKEGGLKQSNFRNTAAFPVIYDAQGKEVDALLPVLKKIIPGLTDKKSVNFAEFMRRYPDFRPSEKTNASKFYSDTKL
jgi:hypothetical protein